MWSHREHLLRVARRRSMSVEDAEDAVHEAMVRAVENPNIDDERLAAWLTTVTMRICFDRYRQLNREAEVSSRSAMAAPAPVPVEEVVCDRAEAKWLARRSESLPARQAEALQLKSEDLDVSQVATHMGLSYEAAESLLARARRALRTSLASTLALAAWLGRSRVETVGPPAAATAMASTAATLAVLGMSIPHPHHESAQHAPEVPVAEKVDEPDPERERQEPAPPSSHSKPRPDSGPASGPAHGRLLQDVTSLLPELVDTPDLPIIPLVHSLSSDLGLPDVLPKPPGSREPAEQAEPAKHAKHAKSPEQAEEAEPDRPTRDLPRVELPSGELPRSEPLPLDLGTTRD